MVTNEVTPSNVDLGQVESWVRLMHDRSEGYVHVCSTLSWSGQVFDLTKLQMPQLLSYVQWLHDQGVKGIYLRVSTIGRALNQGERGSVSDSVSLPGFWADIDIAGPGHKTTKPLPPNEAEAAAILTEAGLPEPTLWVHSGGGLYPWWLFAEPIHLVADFVDVIQDISTRWQDVIVAAAERLGYSYGGVGDLARVMRLPGTVNRKTDDPKLCRIITDAGRYFSDEEIEAALETAERRMRELTPIPEKRETPVIPMPRSGGESVGERPGDDLAARMTWDEIMASGGYQFHHQQGEETHWVRPGKDRRDGASCTTNYRGSDLLYVFSTEMEGFESNQSYTKFAVWCVFNNFGTDHKAASKYLRAQGFGSQRPQPRPPQPFQPDPRGEDGGGGGQEEPAPVVVTPHFRSTDVGNGQYLQQAHGNQFRMVSETSSWNTWGGRVWGVDKSAAIDRAAVDVSEMIIEQAEGIQMADPDHDDDDVKCKCKGCALRRWGLQSQSDTRIKAMISRFKGMPGITVSAEDFDRDRTVMTVGNGVLNPETRELHPFDPRRMLTRQMGANFDPQATAPKFEAFLEQVLPDPDVRDYVQRAMGYTLLGENDQRAIFMLHGPSGTGKSQFLLMMESIFGSFGATAPAATFRQRGKGDSSATNDLHFLRGKRFITTSETSETSAMDEELIKRLTGRDTIASRELYEKNTNWVPECAVWLATNFPPKLNSDDSAIWDRFKPIHFSQQFSRKAGNEVPDLGRKILAEEAAGILNWLLEGVAKYRERGLGEPEVVEQASVAQRLEADNVAQFLNASLEEGVLVENKDASIRRSTLYDMYETWCKRERLFPLGHRRFNNRVRALKSYGEIKSGVMCWSGVQASASQGFLGRMG